MSRCHRWWQVTRLYSGNQFCQLVNSQFVCAVASSLNVKKDVKEWRKEDSAWSNQDLWSQISSGWDVWVHPGNPSVTFSALELSSALLVPKLCIFIASKHQPYRHHQVQKCAKICLNCIQSPSITNSQMFYMDRWSEDDFSIECISLIEGTFPLSLINVETLFIEEEVISLSISALWGLCYRDVWVSRKWSGKIFSPLSDGPHSVSCGELSVPQIIVWSPEISLGSFSGYWMMRNLIPWWEIEAWVKMNLPISSLIIDWQGTITLSACILWL